MSDQFTIYHNPRCTKSRQSLALLGAEGIEPEVILYLDDSPSRERLVELSELLDMKPIGFTRTKEPIFKEKGLRTDMSDDEIFDALARWPQLIERPIVVKNNEEAVIGRPPENIHELL